MVLITKPSRQNSRSFRAIVVASLFCVSCFLSNTNQILGQERTSRAKVNAEREAEIRYHKFINKKSISAKDWYVISDWCLMVANDLPPRSRQIFKIRGRESIKKAENIILQKINTIFSKAEESINNSPTYSRGLEIRHDAEKGARDYLDEIVPVIKDRHSQKNIVSSLESRIDKLDEILVPLNQQESIRKANSGMIPVEGAWVPIQQARGRYLGFRDIREIAKSPDSYLNRTVSTEIHSQIKPFHLLDIALLDGFDKKMNFYLVPNFMEDRLAISLPKNLESWISQFKTKHLGGSSKSQKGSKRGALHRIRLVIEIKKQMLQHTTFYEGEVKFMAVIDNKDNMLGYFNAEEDL